MPNLSGLDSVEVDEGRTGSYDYTFDDIHTDAEVNTENYDNDEDTRGDTYYTGSFADAPIMLPDLSDSSGTDRTSDLISLMTTNAYARVRLTKENGETMVLDKTKIKVSQETNSNVGSLDPWMLQLRDVDTSGPFYWS